jgi:CheY-like chemotaxis protein
MPQKQKRLLILEDHPGLGNLIKELFSTNGFDVSLATNGVQGLEFASEGGFDAIISDIKMPQLDGIGFLRALQANPPKVKNGPIIMYSNFAYQFSKDEVLSLGATDFIAKDTVSTGELLQMIKDLTK